MGILWTFTEQRIQLYLKVKHRKDRQTYAEVVSLFILYIKIPIY